MELGEEKMSSGDYRGAEQQFLISSQIETTESAFSQLGAARVLQRKYSMAEMAYRRALEIHPGFPPALDGLGKMLYDNHQYKNAIDRFLLAYKGDPTDPVAIWGLATSYDANGDVADARKYFTLYLKSEHLPNTAAYARDWLRRH